MKISTLIQVVIVEQSTGKVLDSDNGSAASVIIPRVGEYVEFTIGTDIVMFEVRNVGHDYTAPLRNKISIYVKEAGKLCMNDH